MPRTSQPRVGTVCAPDMPLLNVAQQVTAPSIGDFLHALGCGAMVCVANIAVGFGLGYAVAAYRRTTWGGEAVGGEGDALLRPAEEEARVMVAEREDAMSAVEGNRDAHAGTGKDLVQGVADPVEPRVDQGEKEVQQGEVEGSGEEESAVEAETPVQGVAEKEEGHTHEVERLRVSRLYVYPIKACAGVAVVSARATDRGLENDRLFMLVDHSSRSLTQRKFPRLALVRPTVEEDGALRISAPDMEAVRHVPKKWGTRKFVTHLSARCFAVDQGDDVAAFFEAFLGKPGVRLVRMSEGFVRRVSAKYDRDGKYQTSFSDGWPYLLVTEASLAEVQRRVEKELDMLRFRPNIVVEGEKLQPFEEDGWERLAVGKKSEFRVMKGCERCKVVTVDPERGVPDEENQPTKALKEFRSFGKTVVFGQNLVPTKNARGRATIHVGDAVTVMEVRAEVPSSDGA